MNARYSIGDYIWTLADQDDTPEAVPAVARVVDIDTTTGHLTLEFTN